MLTSLNNGLQHGSVTQVNPVFPRFALANVATESNEYREGQEMDVISLSPQELQDQPISPQEHEQVHG